MGVECFLLGPEEGSDGVGAPLLIPMSYRGAPLEGAEEHLIGTTDHSVLGKRWVYDGCADPVAVSAILSAITTGGHEAALTMEQDGEIVTFEPTCRVAGSGSASDGVRVDTVTLADAGDPTIIPRRRPRAGARPGGRHPRRGRPDPHRPVGRPRSRRRRCGPSFGVVPCVWPVKDAAKSVGRSNTE